MYPLHMILRVWRDEQDYHSDFYQHLLPSQGKQGVEFSYSLSLGDEGRLYGNQVAGFGVVYSCVYGVRSPAEGAIELSARAFVVTTR